MTSCALTIKECHKSYLFRLIILVRYILLRASTSRSHCQFPSVLTALIIIDIIIVVVVVIVFIVSGYRVIIIIIIIIIIDYRLIRLSVFIVLLFYVCHTHFSVLVGCHLKKKKYLPESCEIIRLVILYNR